MVHLRSRLHRKERIAFRIFGEAILKMALKDYFHHVYTYISQESGPTTDGGCIIGQLLSGISAQFCIQALELFSCSSGGSGPILR